VSTPPLLPLTGRATLPHGTMKGATHHEDTMDELDVTLPTPTRAQPATLKILEFARHYLECGNQVEAARRAGFQGTDAALKQTAQRLLARDDVGLYVAKHLTALISPEEVGSILSEIARASIEHFIKIQADGSIEWDFSTPQAQSNLRIIKSIKQTAHGLHVTIHDPLPALALIAKYTRLDDAKTTQRRAVEALLAQLPAETRAFVREHIEREASADVIEGETPAAVPDDLDLSFLRPGVLPVDVRGEDEVDAEADGWEGDPDE